MIAGRASTVYVEMVEASGGSASRDLVIILRRESVPGGVTGNWRRVNGGDPGERLVRNGGDDQDFDGFHHSSSDAETNHP